MSSQSTRARGLAAEEEAARFLESRGLVVVERNVTIGGAEIDLIATLEPSTPSEPETVVFVEVRSRDDVRAGTPIETIDRRKRSRLRRAAAAWLVARGLWERVAVRFDAIGIVTDEEAPRIEWIPGAFDGDER
ncbi:MAG: YraN family protein [Myxococcales bacterium]|nr:YraN family protein [Myxococcales bacterium]MCB9568596.1 YraN family protein [Myxococcales bacterium]MCB9706028.1 YraN family protein [Myxococcales bacterium]